MKIEDFCDQHNACAPGREWARSTGCTTMAELWQCWQRLDMPADYRIWIATRHGVLADGDLRLWLCWCVRRAWRLLGPAQRAAIEVAERYAAGQASASELHDANSDAEAAASFADSYAARAAGYAARAAGYAARVAAMDAATNSARAAASAAAMAESSTEDGYADRGVARAAQAAELLRRFPRLFQEAS